MAKLQGGTAQQWLSCKEGALESDEQTALLIYPFNRNTQLFGFAVPNKLDHDRLVHLDTREHIRTRRVGVNWMQYTHLDSCGADYCLFLLQDATC